MCHCRRLGWSDHRADATRIIGVAQLPPMSAGGDGVLGANLFGLWYEGRCLSVVPPLPPFSMTVPCLVVRSTQVLVLPAGGRAENGHHPRRAPPGPRRAHHVSCATAATAASLPTVATAILSLCLSAFLPFAACFVACYLPFSSADERAVSRRPPGSSPERRSPAGTASRRRSSR